ncbi:MAG: hypothetical protein ACREPS_01660 [Rhodanobacteraceae bacterium]
MATASNVLRRGIAYIPRRFMRSGAAQFNCHQAGFGLGDMFFVRPRIKSGAGLHEAPNAAASDMATRELVNPRPSSTLSAMAPE